MKYFQWVKSNQDKKRLYIQQSNNQNRVNYLKSAKLTSVILFIIRKMQQGGKELLNIINKFKKDFWSSYSYGVLHSSALWIISMLFVVLGGVLLLSS